MTAFVIMGGDENIPIYHDFFGTKSMEKSAVEVSTSAAVSSGGHALVSDLGFERQGVNNSEVFHFHGRQNDPSKSEANLTFLGRKRSNPDSAYIGLLREKMFPIGSDSPESSHRLKKIEQDVAGERIERSHGDEMLFSMQPPPRPTSSVILHPPVNSRHDSLVSKWERSIPFNPGPMMHYPSRFGQIKTYVDKLSSSFTYRDTSASTSLISLTATDEGSRTGIKGSRVMSATNPSSGSGQRNSTGMVPCSTGPRVRQTTEPSQHSIESSSRQMTIFYAGQAHVFDDVHPNKADVILALAGSNGGSWSTTYSGKKSNMRPTVDEAIMPGRENELQANNSTLAIQAISDCGLKRQSTQIPVTSDLPCLRTGVHQDAKAARDPRPASSALEPNTEGRGDVQ